MSELSWKHATFAVGIGLLLGLGQTLQIAMPIWTGWPQVKLGLVATIASRWVPLLVAVCCALLLASNLVHARGRHVPLRHEVLAVIAAAVGTVLLMDPLCLWFASLTHRALAIPVKAFWSGLDPVSLLAILWVRSIPMVIIVAAMWLCVDHYMRGARRDLQALAAAQIRLAGVQRRALNEELRSAQARVEPAFLFETLSMVEQRFEPAPKEARQLLATLIRYLRAALPKSDDEGCTLGQQADLVRAYLEIESVRHGGLLSTRVEASAGLDHLPVAPLLLLPLVAVVVEGSAGMQTHVTVRMHAIDSRIEVEIEDERSRPGAIEQAPLIGELRHRLRVLYGDGAELHVSARGTAGSRVRLRINLANP